MTNPAISVLPSQDAPDPRVIRAPRGANPVNSPGGYVRRTAPPEGLPAAGYKARFLHPGLNTEPWSTSQARIRTEGKTQRVKARRNSGKRRKASGYK